MVEWDLNAHALLVLRARRKAARNGTTLEAALVVWLERYVDEPDEASSEPRAGTAPRRLPPLESAHPTARLGRRPSNTVSPVLAGGDASSRSLAYRRLLNSLRDSSPRARSRDDDDGKVER